MIEWQKTYGGSKDDRATSIKEIKDGEYIVAGSSSSTDGDIKNPKGADDIWLIKLNADGDLIWQKSYGGSSVDWAFYIQITKDGGYIVVGYSNSTKDGKIWLERDYLILKLDKMGGLVWEKNYGGKSQVFATCINDSINLPIDCTLHWKQNVPGCSYWIQISKNENFSQLLINTTIKDTLFKCSKLDFFHTYHWRVKAVVGTEQCNWSPFWRFTTMMDSVNLLSPTDLTINNELPLDMAWNKGIYQKDYRFQLAEEKEFKDVYFDTLISKNSINFKSLKNYTPYFWRVRNESVDTLGYWSKIWQFETAMEDLILIYPENNQTGLEQEIKFKWSDVIGAEYYQLQISKNDQFTNLVYSMDSLTTTEQTVGDLEAQTLYYWRVRVWNEESIGTEYWSEVWTFTAGNSSVSAETAGITIVPNPAGDFITIKLGAINPNTCQTTPTLKRGVDEVVIYNTLGERVMSEPIHPMTASPRMNIERLPRGMYFVKAGGEVCKFVKL